jgi:hypothetical protein
MVQGHCRDVSCMHKLQHQPKHKTHQASCEANHGHAADKQLVGLCETCSCMATPIHSVGAESLQQTRMLQIVCL